MKLIEDLFNDVKSTQTDIIGFPLTDKKLHKHMGNAKVIAIDDLDYLVADDTDPMYDTNAVRALAVIDPIQIKKVVNLGSKKYKGLRIKNNIYGMVLDKQPEKNPLSRNFIYYSKGRICIGNMSDWSKIDGYNFDTGTIIMDLIDEVKNCTFNITNFSFDTAHSGSQTKPNIFGIPAFKSCKFNDNLYAATILGRGPKAIENIYNKLLEFKNENELFKNLFGDAEFPRVIWIEWYPLSGNNHVVLRKDWPSMKDSTQIGDYRLYYGDKWQYSGTITGKNRGRDNHWTFGESKEFRRYVPR